jgi:ubiquinone/menaquinone biosynthesis C-methylase UbiE
MTQMSEREFEAFQGFVLATKVYWSRDVFADLKQIYERNLAAGKTNQKPGPERVKELFKGETTDEFHGWFERHLQRMKYSGRCGLVPFHNSRREELVEALDVPLADGLLELDAGLPLPDYYTSVDVHQHPGGVWSDEIAGLVYERGAKSTTPLLSRDRDLHERFADLIQKKQASPKDILDMGCGFGKTTQPLCDVNRDAKIVGVDLSAPCLRVAARTATMSQTRNVHYAQRNSAATGYPDQSFDIVTSTMMLHEMPAENVRAVIAESLRLLRPNGLMIHLDFLPPDDEFLSYLHLGHSYRNNEPWMRSLLQMDVGGTMASAGFKDIEIEPFEETPGALAEAGTKWRFPWTTIAARKPA